MLPVLPESYATTFAELKARIESERLRVVLAANSAMVLLYWDIGRVILARQENEGWGAKVVDRLSADLSRAFPDMRGLSPRNLRYMRAFAAAWPDRGIVQEVLAGLTWYHNLALMEKLSAAEDRLWYARKACVEGWSRNILALQISRRLHEREGRAQNNFPVTLPPRDSDMAAQVFKDPYLFDFLGTADPRREAEVERALVEHVQTFLLELGVGFAFVGKQVRITVGDKDSYLDLLFYHLRLRCFVVIELKAVPFEPAFTGQLSFYLSAVDNQLRHPADAPTIGLLLCRGKDRVEVEYALQGLKQPVGVADWETQLVRALPEDLQASLPSVEELERELADGAPSPDPAGPR